MNEYLTHTWFLLDRTVTVGLSVTTRDASQGLCHFGAYCTLVEQEVSGVELLDWACLPACESKAEEDQLLDALSERVYEEYCLYPQLP